jgi:ABC-type sugar transport system ATPase subunit
MNLIKGTMSRDGSIIDSAIGPLPCTRKLSTAEAGEAAVVGIRPSDLRLATGGESGVAASIAMLEPLGDVTVISMETGGETLRLVLSEAAASGLQPGQRASIVLDPRKLHVFRASDGQVIT